MKASSRKGPGAGPEAEPGRPAVITAEALDAALQARGLRRSAVRTVILEAFVQANQHLSAEQLTERVRAQLPHVSPSTIYRTLNLLVSAGLANARFFGDGHTRFEPASVEHHDHLVCTRCGAITEFVDDQIESLQADVARLHGFDLSTHQLELYGVCRRCRTLDA